MGGVGERKGGKGDTRRNVFPMFDLVDARSMMPKAEIFCSALFSVGLCLAERFDAWHRFLL